MSKRDLKSILDSVQKLYKSDETINISLGTGLKTLNDSDFLTMPEWWQKGTNTKGLPFGGYVVVAGDTDSGKTSGAIEAMKAAQSQDTDILYVETENKTTVNDLLSWGVDPDGIMLVKESVAERAYKGMFSLWDAYFRKFPDGKLLVVIDSLGNILSKHDVEMDIENDSQRPGGKGKTNRLGISRLITKARENKVTMYLISYTYDNMGSHGKTVAGGKALTFYSSLTYQTNRKGWYETTVKGDKVRKGAIVQWKLTKNHINKDSPGPKVAEFKITSDGIEFMGKED